MTEIQKGLDFKTRSKIFALLAWYLWQAHLFAVWRLFELAKEKLLYVFARIRSWLLVIFSGQIVRKSRRNSRLSRLLATYRRIWDRGTTLLFEHFEGQSLDPRVLEHFVAKCSASDASAERISSTASLAVSAGELDRARSLFADLLRRFPEETAAHQQVGVRAFILGKYEIAEEFWTQATQLRERQVVARELDRYQVRLLGTSWVLAIGHIAHFDTYFKQAVLQKREGIKTYLSLHPWIRIPNRELLARWSDWIDMGTERDEPRLSSVESALLRDEFWSLPFPDGKSRMFSHAGAIVQRQWETERRPPLLSLSAGDRERGQSGLRQLGVPEGAWFVCLHVREPGFHLKWHQSHPGTRNADVMTYLPAAREIVARGGYVIRVGDPSMVHLPQEPGVVDYAHSEIRSEFMDVFLCAACKFFIGTNSGLGLVPPIFGVPCAMTNWSPIGLPQWYPKDIYIPKQLYSDRMGRTLTFEEMLFSKAGWVQFEDQLAMKGIRSIDNSPEELTDLVVEMIEREDGLEVLTEEDHKMQKIFNELVVGAGSYVGARIGTRYLRRHPELFKVSDLRAPLLGS